MKPVRLGIIGCGVIGKQHAAAAVKVDGVELVAVADLIAETAQKVAKEHGAGKWYDDGMKLLADDDIEAVVVALPTCGRLELVLEAFKRGKHVLDEKPVAMNAGDVRKMIAAKGELVGGCCSSRFQYYPHTKVAAKAVADGLLGEIRVMHVRCLSSTGEKKEGKTPIPWRLKMAANGGGYLVNWGVYDLDYLMTITGWKLKPRVVLGQTWQVPGVFGDRVAEGSDAETHVVATVLCDGGSVIHIERGETTTAGGEVACRIVGDKGSLELQMSPSDGKQVVLYRADAVKGAVKEVLWEGDEGWSEASTGLLEDFASAIRGGGEMGTSLEKAIVIQEICDAVYESARTGKAVEIG